MRVLATTDLSEGADVGLREAAALASSPEDALAVVHVLPPLPFGEMWLPQLGGDRAKVVAKASEVVRQRMWTTLGCRGELFIEDGADYAAIIERAEEWRADVVVLGSHGRSGIARAFGSVAERVLRHAHCSVLVARPSGARGWVLAATDLSEPSLPAVAAAGIEARRRGAQLEVVRALGFLDVEARYLVELATPSNTPTPGVFEVAARELSDCVTRLELHARCKVLDRPEVTSIVGEAEAIGAELVVLGARGKTGLARLALGSVAEKVARLAPCSVLVVRATPPA